jgi:hypothetical protein
MSNILIVMSLSPLNTDENLKSEDWVGMTMTMGRINIKLVREEDYRYLSWLWRSRRE